MRETEYQGIGFWVGMIIFVILPIIATLYVLFHPADFAENPREYIKYDQTYRSFN